MAAIPMPMPRDITARRVFRSSRRSSCVASVISCRSCCWTSCVRPVSSCATVGSRVDTPGFTTDYLLGPRAGTAPCPMPMSHAARGEDAAPVGPWHGGAESPRGPQHMLFEQSAGHLRDAPFQLGQRGVHGGAGLVHLVAELSGVRIHGTGSSSPLSSDTPAKRGTSALPGASLIPSPRKAGRGGSVRHHPAARMAGTNLAPLTLLL
jgi:hypothetical protein